MSKNNKTIEELKEGFLAYKENILRESLKNQGITGAVFEETIIYSKDKMRKQLELDTVFHVELFEWLQIAEKYEAI